jgi:HEAT repeat protein
MYQDLRDEYRHRYTKPDSLKILNENDSGNERAWALRAMEEPSQHGGTPQLQEHYVKILSAVAAADRDPLCRLEAVRMLGRYKDARAVPALEEAYWNAKVFPADAAKVLRQQVLASLGQSGNPSARELLIQVARAGAKEDTQEEKLQTLDLRLSAIRGLAAFKQSDVTETLYHVLATEKDIALRDRACLSLQTVTGTYLPADPQKWDKLLHGSPAERDAVAREGKSLLTLVSWWQQ